MTGKIRKDASSRPASGISIMLVVSGQENAAQAACAEALWNVWKKPVTAIPRPFCLDAKSLAQEMAAVNRKRDENP